MNSLTSVGMFSGGAPKGFTNAEWEKVKADHANAFKVRGIDFGRN